MAHYVRNIRMGESPRWMKRHLALCGLRSISNVVDITNHTLLEMGQPMHAFDLNKVAGRTIDVRRAHEGEKIVTLDEKEFTLNPNNLVICDAEKPVASGRHHGRCKLRHGREHHQPAVRVRHLRPRLRA